MYAVVVKFVELHSELWVKVESVKGRVLVHGLVRKEVCVFFEVGCHALGH